MTATVRMPGQNRITQSRIDGVSVIRPSGALDRELADDVREQCLEAHAPVVIDLDGCVLADTAALQRLATEWQLYRPHMCIASSRPTARRLLRRAGVVQHVPVFASVEDAMAADGWRPSTAR